MATALRYLGQAAVYLLIAVAFGIFSDSPAYQHRPTDRAELKISFAHGAARKGECRKLTREEMEKIAANMRRAEVCPRERLPVLVELQLDGEILFRESLPPTGLSRDGPSIVYRRFSILPGPHRLTVRLRDSARTEGFDYELDTDIDLQAQKSLAIDFRSETGGFILSQGRRPAAAEIHLAGGASGAGRP